MASRVYLNNAAAAATPSAALGAWDDGPTLTWRHLGRTKAGAATEVSRNETSTSATWDVYLWTGVSDELSAQTIAGTLDGCVKVRQPNTGSNFVFHLHVWVMKPDGTARGTLLADAIDDPLATQEWPVNSTPDLEAKAFLQQALSSVGASAGDRIVAEIGFQAQNTSSTLRAGVVGYGGTGADATDTDTDESHASWIEFSQTLLWLADAAGTSRAQAIFVG